jgi:hypothetical protein
MASWFELQQELALVPIPDRGNWVTARVISEAAKISQITGRHVIVYASAFLQKPMIPGIFLSVTAEDINGFMTSVHGADCSKGLLLVIHTPGGSAEAAETIVDYLRTKFDSIVAAIPTYAMSAGTMIALASDKLIMGRQSQLGPTDPQLILGNRQFSAHSITQQFEEAKAEISKDPTTANAWYPVLQPFGPALLQEARKALAYGDALVKRWLVERMLKGRADADAVAEQIAKHFSGSHHGSHGHRISRDEARSQGILVDDLETTPPLQDAVLSLYHMITVAFDSGPAAKLILGSHGQHWIKNVTVQQVVQAPATP